MSHLFYPHTRLREITYNIYYNIKCIITYNILFVSLLSGCVRKPNPARSVFMRAEGPNWCCKRVLLRVGDPIRWCKRVLCSEGVSKEKPRKRFMTAEGPKIWYTRVLWGQKARKVDVKRVFSDPNARNMDSEGASCIMVFSLLWYFFKFFYVFFMFFFLLVICCSMYQATSLEQGLSTIEDFPVYH